MGERARARLGTGDAARVAADPPGTVGDDSGGDAPSGGRERALAAGAAALAGPFVGDVDADVYLADVAGRCAALTGADAAVVMSEADGSLRLAATAGTVTEVVMVAQALHRDGPAAEAYRTGAAVAERCLDDPRRWPTFAALGRAAGYRAAGAVPMRHGDATVGAVAVLRPGPPGDPADLLLAEALVGVATASLVQHRACRHAADRGAALEGALHSRVVVEQAKGMLAARLRIDVAQAFTLLRSYARNHNTRLADVASSVVVGRLPARDLVAEALRIEGRRTVTRARRVKPIGAPGS